MRPLAHRLHQHGFDVVFHAYSARQTKSTDLVTQLHDTVIAKASANNSPIHFVTHSLGGIVLRAYLSSHHPKPSQIQHAVMLAPPNHGSEVVDFWRAHPMRKAFFKMVMGDIALSLHTGKDSLPNQLPTLAHHSIGIINGTISSDPWFNPLFKGTHDGKVSTASTHLHHNHPNLSVATSHTFMMRSNIVQSAVISFLQSGHF